MVKEYEIQVRWVAFPLHPYIPDEGWTLDRLFAGKSIDIPAIKAHLRRVARELGLPLSDRDMTYNSRRAQELGKWAEQQGRGNEYHDAVFRAYFADGSNIARSEVLVGVAEAVGLDPDEARKVLEARAFREAVDRDWERSRILGVTAVPTFLSGRRALVGAQPYEALEQMVRAQDIPSRKAHRKEPAPKHTRGA